MTIAPETAIAPQAVGLRARWRLLRLIALGLLGGLLLTEIIVSFGSIATAGDLGQDYWFYREVGARWLAGGSFYLPHQLAGPYSVALMADVLYPPSALFLFVPLVWLPWPVWWIIPVGLLVYVLWYWRPSFAGWAGVLLLLMWPRANAAFIFGTSDIWAMAGVAAALRFGWPGALLLLKPSFAPFALIGIRRRGWWVAAIVLAVVSLALLPLWFQYVTAMRNLAIGSDYSLGSVPLLLVPLVAWRAKGRSYRSGATAIDPSASV